jgi:hypothetical protein
MEADAQQSLETLGAQILSKGDETIMGSRTEPTSLLAFSGITFVLGLIAYILTEISNYREIRRHWSHYRCHPTIAPFAKYYGHDLAETMNFCAGEAVKEHAGPVIAPIYDGINRVMGVADGIYEKAEAVEGGVMGLLKGFESFVVNFVNSFRLVGTRVRMSLIRIKDIFARVYGTFIAFTYAAISAITFGENMACNPLTTFIAGFAGVDICCFAPDTELLLDDGSSIQIANAQIGTHLYGCGRITSRYMFNGSTTPMVRIHGIHVSENHYVLHGGRMIQARAHPEAEVAQSIPVIWCIATETNRMPVLTADGATLICADYEEDESPETVAAAQKTAEELLNGSAGPTVADYSLGLDPTLLVASNDGSFIALGSITLGTVLANGARVVGIIHEECGEICELPRSNCVVSAAQLIHLNHTWVRAGTRWSSTKKRQILVHLMLDTKQSFYVYEPLTLRSYGVRDYTEVADVAMQAPYDQKLKVAETQQIAASCALKTSHAQF